MATAVIKVTGNVTEALAQLDRLGIKATEVGGEVEGKLGKAAERTSGMFAALGRQMQAFGIEAGAAVGAVGEKMEATEAKSKGLSNSIGGLKTVAALGLAAGAAEFVKIGISAATAAEAIDSQLRTAIDHTGSDAAAAEEAFSGAEAASRKLGFTNIDTKNALLDLTRGTGSAAKAADYLSVAQDLARSKNISLGDAAMSVTKALAGQLRPLKQLGIDLPVSAGGALKAQHAAEALAKAQEAVNAILEKAPDAVKANSKEHAAYEKALNAVATAQAKVNDAQGAGAEIVDALKSRVEGSADAYGKTLKGQLDKAKASFDDMAEKVGVKLIPVLTKMLDKVNDLISYLSSHHDVLVGVGVAIGAIAILIAPVPTLIAALAAGLIYAYTHSKIFRDIVQDAFKVVGEAAQFMWNDVIKPVFKFIVDGFLNTAGMIIDTAAKAFGWVPGLGPKLKEAAAKFGEFKNQVNDELDGIKGMKDISADARAGIQQLTAQLGSGSQLIHNLAAIPNIPATPIGGARASGGPISAGTMYLVGENGPELFMSNSAGSIVPNHELGGAPTSSGRPVTAAGGLSAADTKAAFSQALRDVFGNGVKLVDNTGTKLLRTV